MYAVSICLYKLLCYLDEHSRIVLKRVLEEENTEVWISRSDVEKVEESGFINASYISVSFFATIVNKICLTGDDRSGNELFCDLFNELPNWSVSGIICMGKMCSTPLDKPCKYSLFVK